MQFLCINIFRRAKKQTTLAGQDCTSLFFLSVCALKNWSGIRLIKLNSFEIFLAPNVFFAVVPGNTLEAAISNSQWNQKVVWNGKSSKKPIVNDWRANSGDMHGAGNADINTSHSRSRC